MQSTSSKNLVLFADDDKDDRDLLLHSFNKHHTDIEVKVFEDGIDLLNYTEDLIKEDVMPCLVILDINMPKISGKDVLRLLRQKPKFEKVPVVLFTTSNAPTDSFFASLYDAGFISKPYSAGEMEGIVDKFVSHCNDDVKKKLRAFSNQPL